MLEVNMNRVRGQLLIIRRLRADDLDRCFNPVERVLGEQWLERQKTGELYVAVAEVGANRLGEDALTSRTTKTLMQAIASAPSCPTHGEGAGSVAGLMRTWKRLHECTGCADYIA